MAFETEAEQVAARLRIARRVAVLSGAGMSAESGLATFRGGPAALWRNYDPMTLATPEAFEANPGLVWEWYRERLLKAASAQPNPGHRALAELATRVPEICVITQNVDGLHAAAGSRDVIELHGNVRRARCTRCGATTATPLGDAPPASELAAARSEHYSAPVCAACGGLLRPDVVWFGEELPHGAFERARDAVAHADVFIIAGTSAQVFPAAGLVTLAKRAGAFVVEINPEQTPATAHADVSVRAKSGEFLPLVVAKLGR